MFKGKRRFCWFGEALIFIVMVVFWGQGRCLFPGGCCVCVRKCFKKSCFGLDGFSVCFYFFIKKIYFVFFKFRILSKIKLFFEDFRILPCILKLSFSYVLFFCWLLFLYLRNHNFIFPNYFTVFFIRLQFFCSISLFDIGTVLI